MQQINTEMMPHYYKAKLAADEALTVLGEERVKKEGKDKFSYIILRPGWLSDEKESGKIELGRTNARDKVSRGDVAEVAVKLLETEGANGWFDLLNGNEPTDQAVTRVVKEGMNSMDGEDINVMKANMA
jgi:nucleoside-diphosphate-sugar epimerase